MARHRGSDGHYADVECAYAEFERYLVLSCKRSSLGKKKATGLVALNRTVIPRPFWVSRHSLVLYCTNDRREYRATSSTSDQL